MQLKGSLQGENIGMPFSMHIIAIFLNKLRQNLTVSALHWHFCMKTCASEHSEVVKVATAGYRFIRCHFSKFSVINIQHNILSIFSTTCYLYSV